MWFKGHFNPIGWFSSYRTSLGLNERRLHLFVETKHPCIDTRIYHDYAPPYHRSETPMNIEIEGHIEKGNIRGRLVGGREESRDIVGPHTVVRLQSQRRGENRGTFLVFNWNWSRGAAENFNSGQIHTIQTWSDLPVREKRNRKTNKKHRGNHTSEEKRPAELGRDPKMRLEKKWKDEWEKIKEGTQATREQRAGG